MMPACPEIEEILAETFVARAECHRSLPSTNDRAIECAAQQPCELPLLIVAEQQTAGRGRGSNRWWSGQGGLTFSLLLDPDMVGAERGRPPLLALATAVAIVETLTPLLPGHTIGVHWPNDVFADGRKLAGILVEVLADRRHVVGIGVNTNNTIDDAPSELKPTATTLADLTGCRHEQTTILVTLLKQLAQAFDLLRREHEQIGRRADQMCLQRGQPLILQLGKAAFAGRCAGIAPDGALLLDTPQRRQQFYSGVVQEP